MGKIMIIDMAGLERTKKSAVYGTAMKESNCINQSIMRITNVLKALKYNERRTGAKQKLVPYRESKLTMLMQPILTPGNQAPHTTTSIYMLVSAYPGVRDLAEKKFLLREVEQLRGLSITQKQGIINKGKRKSRYGVGVGGWLTKNSGNGNGNDEKDEEESEGGETLKSKASTTSATAFASTPTTASSTSTSTSTATSTSTPASVISAKTATKATTNRVKSIIKKMNRTNTRPTENSTVDYEALYKKLSQSLADKERELKVWKTKFELIEKELEVAQEARLAETTPPPIPVAPPAPPPQTVEVVVEVESPAFLAKLTSLEEELALARKENADMSDRLEEANSENESLRDQLNEIASKENGARKMSGNSTNDCYSPPRATPKQHKSLLESPLREHIVNVEISSALKNNTGNGGRGVVGGVKPFALEVPKDWETPGKKRKRCA